MFVIAVRVWHLGVVQHNEKVNESRRPQRRVRVEQAERGTIRDRFNVPLAVNRVQYNAAVLYSQVRELPRRARSTHVENLAKLLADELEMDIDRVEDLIHSKAALFPNVPFVIKADVSERAYFRLKMLERDWLGLHAERVPKRFYPKGEVASDIIGYLGAISSEEYESIATEIQQLTLLIEEIEEGKRAGDAEAARRRLSQLRERAYSTHDLVGKVGVEAVYDEQLRGYSGKRVYQQDIYGSYVRELPGGKAPVSGQRILLTISSELQEYAEKLLTENERIRDGRSHRFDRDTRSYTLLAQPWIKGGAIVVLDPNTGEVLTMATYPRFDPNDFRKEAHKWFETEDHIAEIWDGKRPLERDGERRQLTWETYLELVGAETDSIPQDLRAACRMPESDLVRLIVDGDRFSNELLSYVGSQSLAQYRETTRAATVITGVVKKMACELFHATEFAEWREEFGRRHLREKRVQEKARGTYERPYLDYFDRAERALFADFWQRYRYPLVLAFLTGDSPTAIPEQFAEHFILWAKELAAGAHVCEPWSADYHQLKGALPPKHQLAYLQTFRSFADLSPEEKELASAFYPRYGFGYARSYAYRQAAPLGSVFKVLVAYEALMQRYEKGYSNLNPLTMIDDVHRSRKDRSKWNVGFTLAGKPIPQRYKGGSLLRTHRRAVGEIDLVGALETSSNSYFGLLAADHIAKTADLVETASKFSFGQKTGLELPGEYGGYIPRDLEHNRTGLYSFVDGQHSLVVTPLQTATMMAAMVNGGKVFKPQVVRLMAGKEPVRDELFQNPHYAFRETLSLIGVDMPLFTSRDEEGKRSCLAPFGPEVQRTIDIPKPVRKLLIEGMRRVVQGNRGGARPSVMRSYADYPWIIKDYRDLNSQLIGKTGTAEIVEKVGFHPPTIYNHIWSATVSFPPEDTTYTNPELVIVVYLRYGDYGREAAPLAGQMVKKWREINQRAHN